jgi:hypothetical protein
MNVRLVVLAILATSLANAQSKSCTTSAASQIDRSDSVIVEKVTLSGDWGTNVATIFRPDKDIAQGAVLFSHSEIHQEGQPPVDLFPLAITLTRAGAAVIVPERSLTWLPPERTTNREGGVVICAEHWLVEHTKLVNDGKPLLNDDRVIVRWGFAYVGPDVCDPRVSECRVIDPFNSEPQPASVHDRVPVWVPLGETEGGDNTRSIISDSGLGAAKWIQRQLRLSPIQSIVASRPVN